MIPLNLAPVHFTKQQQRRQRLYFPEIAKSKYIISLNKNRVTLKDITSNTCKFGRGIPAFRRNILPQRPRLGLEITAVCCHSW
jgi:hypothetical protein